MASRFTNKEQGAKAMTMPADYRTHQIAVSSELLIRELKTCSLPVAVVDRLVDMAEHIRDDARTLTEELRPAPLYVGNNAYNVIRLRPRGA